MRRTTTEKSQRPTLRLVSGGVGERASASSPFGPVKVGLITMPTPKTRMENQDQVLTELLNSLERKITELSIKSCEVLNIFLNDTAHLARRTGFSSRTDITNETP